MDERDLLTVVEDSFVAGARGALEMGLPVTCSPEM
jgi:hypothetical protein